MTSREVYNLPVMWQTYQLESYLIGCYYNHIKETGIPWNVCYNSEVKSITETINTRIIIKVHCHFKRDFRRFWRLSSVWYRDNEGILHPFMIVQNAGREGDDDFHRFITDGKYFEKACNYLCQRMRDKLPKDYEYYEEIWPYVHNIKIEIPCKSYYNKEDVDTILVNSLDTNFSFLGDFNGQSYKSTIAGEEDDHWMWGPNSRLIYKEEDMF